MKETGLKISNMDRVLRRGQMEQNTMECMYTERSTVKVVSHGQTVAHTTDNSKKIISRVMEHIIGLTAVCSLVLGSIIKWKDRARSRGQMAESTRASM